MTDPVVTDEAVNEAPATAGSRQSSAQVTGLAAGAQPAPAADRLNELRRALFGAEQDQLQRLQHRLDDPHQQAREVSHVLPGAIRLRAQQDEQLTSALTPTVEESIAISVRNNPKRLSDALYPIIGPAIRAAVAHTLSTMIQSLNETLNRSFSWQGFKWRREAWSSGKPFAEVVLLHTLLYRVEQVFLIHRQTGLLLQQVVAPAVAAQDPQLVSGMLTAIQDFVRDSFAVPQGDVLKTLEIGDLDVWAEQGPEAVLAVVIRGEAPEELRQLLQTVLEKIHLEHGAELSDFNGEAALFEACRPELERCLQSQLATTTTTADRQQISPLLVAIPIMLLLLAGWWLFTSIREQRRWQDYVSRLQAEPGIVVVEAEKRGGQFHLSGLRDPLAADPAELLRQTPFAAQQISSHWQPYQDLSPAIVLARARQLLRVPADVTLKLEQGWLVAEGPGVRAWLDRSDAERMARFVPGVAGLRLASAIYEELIRQARFEFAPGHTELRPVHQRLLDQVAEAVRQVAASAAAQQRSFQLIISGSADGPGSAELNQRLRLERAGVIRTALAQRGITAEMKIAENPQQTRDVTLLALTEH